MNSFIDVAKVTGVRASSGRLVLRPSAGLSFLIGPGTVLHFVPPAIDSPRGAVVSETAERPDGNLDVLLNEDFAPDELHSLEGMHCLLEESADVLDRMQQDAPYALLSDGTWTFADSVSGKSGSISGFMEMPGQIMIDCIIDGDDSVHPIPFVDEFILSMDEGSKHIDLALPEGIFEI